MKIFHSTYYILLIICLTMVSCTREVMDGEIDVPKEETQVRLTITFPTNATRATTLDMSPTDGIKGERYINDAQIYVFQGDRFVEKAQGLLIAGKDGDITRTIEGKLSKAYANESAEVVLLTNIEANQVGVSNLTPGVSTKADLYNLLTYKHEKLNWVEDTCSKWIKNIPMWGTTTIKNIKEGLYYSASISLTRAIAKVQVTVNDGEGLANFRINSIKVLNHNTEGYCVPKAEGTPNVPGTTSKASMEFNGLDDAQGKLFVDHIYIPEHKNIGSDSRVQLKISATVYGEDQEYILDFKDPNNSICDVLRNNIYIFNIVSVTPPEPETPPTDVNLEYTVVKWGKIEIDVPEFGEK